MIDILSSERYRLHMQAFALGTEIVRKHFGDDVPLRELFVRFTMVNWLLEHGEITLTKLADLTKVPVPTVSRHLWTCLQEGCISESVDPDDRRRRILTLEAYGGEKFVAFTDDWSRCMREVMEQLLLLPKDS